LLTGPAIEIGTPTAAWCRRQADLVVPTRLQCNVGQLERIAGTRHEEPMRRYLSSRTLLDVPALFLESPLELGRSYALRVADCERWLNILSLSTAERYQLQERLAAALRTKRAPEACECGTLTDAEATLRNVALRTGVAAEAGDRVDFWQSSRPLDVRDWQLRQTLA
jgi:hypothetical protein